MTRTCILAGLVAVLTCSSSPLAFAQTVPRAQRVAAATPAPAVLRVGAAKVEITPSSLIKLEPIALGGGDFESVHDPIFARAMVVDSGSGAVVFVAVDAVHLMDMMPLRERIQRETGIVADHIVIAASHDHSAPRLGGAGPFFRPVLPEQDAYMAATYDKILDVVKRAKAAMQPARMGMATGTADVSVNRDAYTPPRGWGAGYNPAGKSDKTVWVTKFEALDGKPIAVLYNYAVHSIATLNTLTVSGDLAGAASKLVEERYNDQVVALFTVGPAGDQNPRFSGSTPGSGIVAATPAAPPAPAQAADRAQQRRFAYQAMDAQGFMLGAEVVRVAKQIQARTTAPRIVAAETQFVCAGKPDKQHDAFTYQDFTAGVPIRVGVVLMDQTAFTWVSGEVVTNIYARMKTASPLTNTMMLTLSNGRSGYLVDDATYDTPNFEVNTTPVIRGCAENGIVNGLVDLIRQGITSTPPAGPAR